MRPLLFGESDPRLKHPSAALLPWPPGTAGDRLRRHLGMSVEGYLGAFERKNLLWPEARWSARDASLVATYYSGWWPGRPMVLLGARVARAFGVRYRPFTVSGRYAVLPHPSARCRAWNEPRARAAARRTVSRLCPGLLGGSP